MVTGGATALVVGFGSIARRHLRNLRALGVEDLLVYRPQGRPANGAEGPRFVRDLREGMAAEPQLAVIASPSAAHVEALVPLLEAGIPCYVEKPPVTTAVDVQRLRKLLAEKSVVTLTGCNLRFLPSLRRLRDAIRDGSIGTPVRASLQAGQWLPDWRPQVDYRSSYSARASDGGGVLFDLIHEIDMARFLFGEFDQVLALKGRLSGLQLDAEDTACVLLGKPRGPLVAVGLDYVARQRIRRYDVVGDQGTLVWDLAERRLTVTTARGTTTLTAADADFDVDGTYRSAMGEFVVAAKSGAATSQDLLDGLATTELALRARSG